MANIKHKYTKELLELAVANSDSVSGVMKFLNIPFGGGTHSYISKKIKAFGIDMSKFQDNRKLENFLKGARARSIRIKLRPEQILTIKAEERRTNVFLLRRALLELGREYKCCSCHIPGVYNNNPLVLEVDHINCDWHDNRAENLQFICPNCHAQKTKLDGSGEKFSKSIRAKREPKIKNPLWRNLPRLNLRKVVRPSKEELISLVDSSSYLAIGKKFGVSDNAVRKWFKYYGMSAPRKRVVVIGVEPTVGFLRAAPLTQCV